MKTNKTFQNNALTSLDDDYRFVVGKTTGALKNITYLILKGLIAAINWTFSGSVTFSNPVTVATATASGHAVTKAQLDTKQATITGATDMVIKKTASGVSDSILGISATIKAINIPELSIAPTGTADIMGNEGDIGWHGEYVYLKSSAGWLKSSRYNTF